MKIGCCTNMIAVGADGTGVEFVEKLAGLGFDYVELPLAEMMALTEEAFDSLVHRVKESGIPCETCNNFFPGTIRLTGENVNASHIDSYVNAALDRAQRLGVDAVVFGSGPAKNVPVDFPMRDAYRQVAALLRRMGSAAEERGIVIVIEPLRKAECNLINTFAEGCGLAADVGNAQIRVLVDYYHLKEEREPARNIREQGSGYLRHVHFARHEGRGYPKSRNEDGGYREFFEAVRNAGYDLRISLEAYTKDFDRDAPAALAFLRRMTRP